MAKDKKLVEAITSMDEDFAPPGQCLHIPVGFQHVEEVAVLLESQS